jgi:hypothetical protein
MTLKIMETSRSVQSSVFRSATVVRIESLAIVAPTFY